MAKINIIKIANIKQKPLEKNNENIKAQQEENDSKNKQIDELKSNLIKEQQEKNELNKNLEEIKTKLYSRRKKWEFISIFTWNTLRTIKEKVNDHKYLKYSC